MWCFWSGPFHMFPLPVGLGPASLLESWTMFYLPRFIWAGKLWQYVWLRDMVAWAWIIYTVMMSSFSCGSVDPQPDASTAINLQLFASLSRKTNVTAAFGSQMSNNHNHQIDLGFCLDRMGVGLISACRPKLVHLLVNDYKDHIERQRVSCRPVCRRCLKVFKDGSIFLIFYSSLGPGTRLKRISGVNLVP